MYIVEYKSPYSDKLVTKKFKSKYRANAESRAHSYAQERHNDYYQRVTIIMYETLKGKRTSKGITFKGTDESWF